MCGTATNGGPVGACRKCTKVSGTAGDGDGTTQGSCTDSTTVYTSSGAYKCAKASGSAGDGDGTTQGTCASATDVCTASGECKCRKATNDGDGTTQRSCATGKICQANGYCT